MLILYLEDNPMDADLVTRRLRRPQIDMDVIVASTVQEALARLEQCIVYDLVLTDLSLPDGTGQDLIAYIQARNLSLPIVVLTGAGDEEAAVGAIKAGAVDYVAKQPGYLSHLPTLLREACDRYRDQLVGWTRPIRVLHMNCDAADAGSIQQHLLGHAPHIRLDMVSTSADALHRLSSDRRPQDSPPGDTPYDLLLLDCRQPDDHILKFVESLRQMQRIDLPLVVVTGQGNENVAVRILKQGADYLVKHPGYLYQLPGMLENAFHRSLLLRNQAMLRDNLEKLRELFHQPLTGMAFISTDHHWLEVNDRLCTLLGYSFAELTAMTWSQVTHPDDIADEWIQFQAILDGGRDGYERDKRFLHAQGILVWTSVSVRAVRKPDHSVDYLVALVNDITARKEAESQLQLAAKVFESSGDGIFIADADNRIISVNQAFTRITGYSLEEVIGKSPSMLDSDYHSPNFYRQLWQELNTQGHWQGEITDRRKSGEPFSEWLTASVVRNHRGEVTHHIGIFSDMTPYKQAQEKIRFLGHYDALTELPNRTLLQDRVEQSIAAASRDDGCFAMLFLDLDHFKNVNDSLGHLVGDCLLQLVAQRLQTLIRKMDTLSRLGGDEFILVLPNTDGAGAVRVAQKCLDAMLEPFLADGHEISITPSIGISLYPEDGRDFVMLIRNADIAMYHAKESGRNNFQFYATEMNVHTVERMYLENHLRRALEREREREREREHSEFVLHYQPLVDIRTGAIIGCEALIRWQHPDRGLLSPTVFIPVAEESGLIVQIGGWVLNEVCRQHAAWIVQGIRPVTIAVNISALHLQRLDFPREIERALLSHGVSPTFLELEVTESVLMKDSESMIKILRELESMGVRLSIDDFGTGYSSLAYLKRLPIHKLKIDRSFVRDILANPDDATITRAVICMAKSLNLKVIAEGVETFQQLAFLRKQGCNEYQGYYFSPALPVDKFTELLEKRE